MTVSTTSKTRDNYDYSVIIDNDGKVSHQTYTIYRYMHKLTHLNS